MISAWKTYFTHLPFFRMYDVDGNGVIDQEEMTKIVQVKPLKNSKHCKKYCCLPRKQCKLRFKLSTVEITNKSIGPHFKQSLNKFGFKWLQMQAIYDMLGAGAVKPTDTAEERAKNIFNRSKKNCPQSSQILHGNNIASLLPYIDTSGLKIIAATIAFNRQCKVFFWETLCNECDLQKLDKETIRAHISCDELIIYLIVSGWTRTMMEVWQKRSSWRAAFKMTSCRRCWRPMWPRRCRPKKSDFGSNESPGLGVHLRMCTCERDLRRCIYMYFSAFNPQKLGPTWMIARRLFSIPLQCSSDWPDFTMWILTSASLSVAIDRPTGSSRPLLVNQLIL